MLYNAHLAKGAEYGLQALNAVKQRLPELEAVVFGATDPVHEVPAWVTYLRSPPQDVIVEDVYNRSRVFVCSSIREGFGFAATEAMACGCALVTTSNGGSEDYALHGETALVSPPRDVATMVDNIEALLRDDEQRIRIATRGNCYVDRFNWDRSAKLLEAFLEAYESDPTYYQHPAVSR
jgi:glycosyltransferase involved in cell wall biosynthesis